MLVDEPQVRRCLAGMARGLATDFHDIEDLAQEAALHLWRSESSAPGQTRSWYLRGCQLHLQNCVRRGRSVDDAPHRLRGLTPTARITEGSPEETTADPDSLLSQVCADEILETLTPRLGPRERQILRLLVQGCRLREIARGLGISHTLVIRRRNHIGQLARQLGFARVPRASR